MKDTREANAAASEAAIGARAANLEALDAAQLGKTAHGIAARLDRMPVGGWHWKTLALISGAMFCDNLDMYIGGGLIASLLADGWSTVDLNSWFQTITMCGYFIGALLSGLVADKLGRRKALLLFIAIFTVGTACASFSPNMHVLIAMRGLMGIGLGAFIPCGYGPIGEYMPPHKRSRYSSMVGLIANFSPPLGALLTMLVIPMFGWRVIFVAIAVLGIVVFALIWKFLPESPRWLAAQGRFDEADAIVSAAEKSFTDAGVEVPALSEADLQRAAADEGVKQLPFSALFSKKMIKRTITACAAIMALNLIVYTITTWTPTIFVLRGMDVSKSIGMTFVMLMGAPFGILLLSIFGNRHGRKPAIVILLCVLAVAAYLWSLQTDETLIMVIGFILCSCTYYFSILTISTYMGELFPTELRGRGSGVSNAMGRIVSIVTPSIIAFFLQGAGVTAAYTFVGICLVVFAVIIAVFGVETRNRSLEDINDETL